MWKTGTLTSCQGMPNADALSVIVAGYLAGGH